MVFIRGILVVFFIGFLGCASPDQGQSRSISLIPQSSSSSTDPSEDESIEPLTLSEADQLLIDAAFDEFAQELSDGSACLFTLQTAQNNEALFSLDEDRPQTPDAIIDRNQNVLKKKSDFLDGTVIKLSRLQVLNPNNLGMNSQGEIQLEMIFEKEPEEGSKDAYLPTSRSLNLSVEMAEDSETIISCNGYSSKCEDAADDGTLQTRTRCESGNVNSVNACNCEEQTRTCELGQWTEWSGSFEATDCIVTKSLSCGVNQTCPQNIPNPIIQMRLVERLPGSKSCGCRRNDVNEEGTWLNVPSQTPLTSECHAYAKTLRTAHGCGGRFEIRFSGVQ